jgi:2-(1,2-epoxy-1,2-dihydrophenyl)acetyl-CoA isomerase
MTYSTITVTTDAGVATLTLNRPNQRNALTSRMRVELIAALDLAAQEARCIVLTGAGSAFCAGQDLADAGDPDTLDLGRILAEEYEPLLTRLADCPVPTIAAVNGAAVGAGANLALTCDVVIAAESAVFIQSFTRIGLAPDAGGTWRLPRQIGMARAMGTMLFAEPVSAQQAVDWGMIWQAVPDADLSTTVAARARHLADGPGTAFRAIKTALAASPANDLGAQLALEAQLQTTCGATQDFREGVAAFLGKRAPRFTGS